MSKYVYIIEPTDKTWLTTKSVEDDYKLSENETFVEPADGLNTPIIFDGTNWNGAAEPEIELLDLPDSGSSTDKTVSELTLQIAQNKADQDTINAQLLLAAAQQTEKETN